MLNPGDVQLIEQAWQVRDVAWSVRRQRASDPTGDGWGGIIVCTSSAPYDLFVSQHCGMTDA